ncbi:FixH family protein [Cognatishimia sp. MH4019]|uniref:FixH family protein n=1 Tax=Cognatishimia sp. MH4019 TaxID=2854030 RepID=UPI001CD4B31D|nr:FixH family protein [Cognatishimia sp. MH4019]
MPAREMAPFTGRKVFLFTASAFALIIAVNFFMAYSAVSTFPGLETKNSYVASQKFDADRAAQEALGWTIDASVHDDVLSLSVTDKAGQPVELADLSATFGRATSVRDDQSPDFRYEGGLYKADVHNAPGNWNLRMVAKAADGTEFRQRVIVHIR